MFTYFYILGLIAMLVIRAPYNKLISKNNIIDKRKTPEVLLVTVMTIGILIIPFLYSITALFHSNDFAFPLWGRLSGLLLSIAAIWLFWKSHKDLGSNWFPTLEIRSGHQLIRTGIYRYTRHPMYASSLLWGIAQFLMLANWIVGLSPFVSFLLLYLFRVKKEEQMMLDKFGDEYKSYMKTTGRIIPRLFKK
ncbi:protein-S-isoprenylcysteine O-methyltransferase [Shimazuella sp. AN120528]|uniref:protein-S-isoprenylcysteine O-methyltransferase n=1 Tax=Shimazuella soli TaxID=1892854 RepID=UPI001F10F1A3|nr:protein-S-isoprenylcysteine O-methyltransferase [Shimazuella soli]MCH5586187.1 protein-S-isoprenylcysteine O-methyltransferase [Shimazuella soli]